MLDTPVHSPALAPRGPHTSGPPYRSPVAPFPAPDSSLSAPTLAIRVHLAIEERMIAARPRLVRLARLRGVPCDAADDVAQDTLLEAFRSVGMLRDPERLDPWLDAICRNVCRRWVRMHAVLTSRQQSLASLRARPQSEDDDAPDVPDAQTFDLDEELTRHELATLLDRALAHLHPSVREPLALHYIGGLPAEEIAARMRVSTSAVEVRLHRARRELRRVLSGALRDEAEAFDIALPESAGERMDGRRQTRIWCPLCGKRRLVVKIDGTTGYIHYGCPLCGQLAEATSKDLLAGVRSYKPILSRLLTWLSDRFTHGLATGESICFCGRVAKAEPRIPDGMPAEVIEEVGDVPVMHLHCPVCGLIGGADIARLTVDRIETLRFWREHPRIRVLPPRDIEAEGMPAVVMRVQSPTDGAVLDLVWARETLRLLGVHEAVGNG